MIALFGIVGCTSGALEDPSGRLLLEIDETHATPPGPGFDGPTSEYASSLSAKMLCSRAFVAGGSPESTVDLELTLFGFAVLGFSIDEVTIDIDEGARTVTVTNEGDPPRTAVYAGSQGCVIQERGASALQFTPVDVPWEGPSADEPWPRGEVLVEGDSAIDRDALTMVIDDHLARRGLRAAVVVHQGELVGEGYAEGYGAMTPQRGWSTGKSVAATALGRLIDRGLIGLDDAAPVAAWQGDARQDITIRHLLNMSSGLDQAFLSGFDTLFMPDNEHSFIYVDGFDVVADAVRVEAGSFEPGTDYAYRNVNPLTVTAIGRMLYEDDGGEPYAFLQREVFEPLGMRSSVAETDPYGNAIISGAFFTTARDLARLALAHLDGGVFGGEQVLSEDWAAFAYAGSPGFEGYGAFWRNNLDDRFNLPTDAFFANGGFGQKAVAIPSRDLVVSQMGFDPLTDFENFEIFVNEVVAVVDAIEN
ncbi:MAG: serine hydrolase domain-containing protein [Myxococcota bacterium]